MENKLLFAMDIYRKIHAGCGIITGLLIYFFYFATITLLPVFLNEGRYSILPITAVFIIVKAAVAIINTGIMSGVFPMRIYERMVKNGSMKAAMSHNEYGTFIKELNKQQEMIQLIKPVKYGIAWSNNLLVTGIAMLNYFPPAAKYEYMPGFVGYTVSSTGAVLIVLAVILRVRAICKRAKLRKNN